MEMATIRRSKGREKLGRAGRGMGVLGDDVAKCHPTRRLGGEVGERNRRGRTKLVNLF